MITRLLLYPYESIKILDTVFQDGGLVSLVLADHDAASFLEVNDIISLSFVDTSLNPSYNSTCMVIGIHDNIVDTDMNWGVPGPLNPGTITNVCRYSSEISQFVSISQSPVELDLSQVVQFPITYNIADIQKPQNRKSNFSKQIDLPGTKENNKIFSHLYEFDSLGDFNHNLKHRIVVLQDNLEILNGFLRLVSVKRKDWNIVSYQVSIDGEIADLFSRLKKADGSEMLLSDLDFTEWNHIYDNEAVLDSWNGDITRDDAPFTSISKVLVGTVSDTYFSSGGRTALGITGTDLSIGDVVQFVMDNPLDLTVNFDPSNSTHTIVGFDENDYPIINIQFQSGATNSGTLYQLISSGEGYVYPTISYGVNGNILSPDVSSDFRVQWQPWLFCKTVTDKIFDTINFTYESSLFDSQYFKRLITNPPLSANLQMAAAATGDGLTGMSGDSPLSYAHLVEAPNEIYDYTGIYDPTSSVIENNTYNEQQITITLQFQHELDRYSEVFYSFLWVVYVRAYSSLNPDGSSNSNWGSGTGYLKNQYTLFYGNSQWSQQEELIVHDYTTLNHSEDGSRWYLTTNIQDTFILKPLEQIRFVIYAQCSGANPPGHTHLWRMISPFYLNVSASFNVPTLTKSLSCKDYLLSLISMFNLYIDTDKQIANKVIIEPSNTYYLPEYLDWTDKLDTSKDIVLELISNTAPKKYVWTYADGDTYFSKNYKDTTKEVYGQESFESESEFATQTSTIKANFGPSVLSDRSSIQVAPVAKYDITLPVYVKEGDESSPSEINQRILYWLGPKYCNNDTYINLGYTGSTSGIQTKTEFGTSTYGYAGTFDNPYDSTLDINFGTNQFYYFGNDYDVQITDNTLVKKFYDKYLRELDDERARKLTCFMKLSSLDIANLSFRKIYQIKDQYWKLQKITDYDPLKNETTQCEFLKVFDVPYIPAEEPTYCPGAIIISGAGITAANGVYCPDETGYGQFGQNSWTKVGGEYGKDTICVANYVGYYVLASSEYSAGASAGFNWDPGATSAGWCYRNLIDPTTDNWEVYDNTNIPPGAGISPAPTVTYIP